MFGPLCGFPDLGRTRVMGVLNVTPDSFSDGGRWSSCEAAVRHGLDLVAAGADLVDVGGESTRPGAPRVAAADELSRVVPVVAGLVAAGATVSVDTSRALVAAAALDAGATLVNDVTGGSADPALPVLVGRRGVPYVVMHSRGDSREMASRATYQDVLADTVRELRDRLRAVRAAGVDEQQIVLDPGLGFAKQGEQNWALLAGLDAFQALGRPVLVGASRKSFLGALLAGPDGLARPVSDRDDATAAVSALAAAAGAWAVRVHHVRPSADAVRVGAAWRTAGRGADR